MIVVGKFEVRAFDPDKNELTLELTGDDAGETEPGALRLVGFIDDVLLPDVGATVTVSVGVAE